MFGPSRSISTTVSSHAPVKISGSSIVASDAAINRLGAKSCTIAVNRAAVTGTPDSSAWLITLYSVATSATTGGTSYQVLETALDPTAAGITYYEIQLDDAMKYIYVGLTPTYSNGTSPGNLTSITVTLNDYIIEPANTKSVLPAI